MHEPYQSADFPKIFGEMVHLDRKLLQSGSLGPSHRRGGSALPFWQLSHSQRTRPLCVSICDTSGCTCTNATWSRRSFVDWVV